MGVPNRSSVHFIAHNGAIVGHEHNQQQQRGFEKPCTTPAQTSAFIGLKPRKFIATPIRVKTIRAP